MYTERTNDGNMDRTTKLLTPSSVHYAHLGGDKMQEQEIRIIVNVSVGRSNTLYTHICCKQGSHTHNLP